MNGPLGTFYRIILYAHDACNAEYSGLVRADYSVLPWIERTKTLRGKHRDMYWQNVHPRCPGEKRRQFDWSPHERFVAANLASCEGFRRLSAEPGTGAG